MRRGGAVHEQRERDAQMGQPLISARPAAELLASDAFEHDAATGTVSLSDAVSGFFPHDSAASAVSRLKARLAAKDRRGHEHHCSPDHSKAAARSRCERRGTERKQHDGIWTGNPYDNQVVATFDDLTDEQVTQLWRSLRTRSSRGARTSTSARPCAGAPRRSSRTATSRAAAHAGDGQAVRRETGRGAASRGDLRLLRRKREAFLAPERLSTASSMSTPWWSAPHWSDPGDSAVELPWTSWCGSRR